MRAWDTDRASSLTQELQQLPGALLPMLHALQEEFGYVDEAAVPPRRHTLKMCRAEACQSMGCDRVIDHVEKRLGVKLGETLQDHEARHRHRLRKGLSGRERDTPYYDADRQLA